VSTASTSDSVESGWCWTARWDVLFLSIPSNGLRAVSAEPWVHVLFSTGTADPGSEDNSMEIKACARNVCKMHKKFRRIKH